MKRNIYHKLILLIFHHEGNTAVLFLDDTLVDRDASFDYEKMIVDLLGSDRFCVSLSQRMYVCGQTIIYQV